MLRPWLRPAHIDDVPQLLELASHLDSFNLPHDVEGLRACVQRSQDSFAQRQPDAWQREYMFVLLDAASQRLLGTATAYAQVGRPGSPYVYFRVHEEQRESQQLGLRMQHRVLRLQFDEAGPSEIGGLVLHPDIRSSSQRLGRLVSYVRFLWMAMHRSDFRDEVVAELLPPLLPEGDSPLWQALGHCYTGLSYRQADRLSKQDKRFIRELFPAQGIEASLLSKPAQAVLGQVGEATQAARQLLLRIGFADTDRIDPFDGGPHMLARTDAITLVQRAQCVDVPAAAQALAAISATRSLLAVDLPEPPWFRCWVLSPGESPEPHLHALPAGVQRCWLLPEV